ncbi:MAG: serine protease [Myxococcota bacterium]
MTHSSPALLLSTLIVIGCADPEVSSIESSVVYGSDNRTDVYAHRSAFWRTVARESIVALIDEDELDQSDPSDIQVLGTPLGERRDLCDSERFRDQPTGASCSGTLIDYDLVLTAGHCVEDAAECDETRFVFDYFYEAEGRLRTIESSDVYRCEEIVVTVDDGSLDYAVVRLDRLVDAERTPVPVRRERGGLSVRDPLVVLGFGSGLPLKIDDGGEVRTTNRFTLNWFGANTDTFSGNSGSGVFTPDGEVVGITVRGATDYEERGDCSVVNTLGERPLFRSERTTYAFRAMEGLCESDTESALCEGGGLCRFCRTSADCGRLTCSNGACLPRCEEGCPTGFRCDAGLCEPETTLACDGSDVVELRCGRPARTVEACDFCVGDACIDATEGDTCDSAIELAPISQSVTGSTAMFSTPTYEGSCAGEANETVYRFDLTEPTSFRAHASGFDTALYLREVCDDASTEVACDDDSGDGFDALLEQELAPGTYFLFVDGYEDESGEYVLDLEFASVEVDGPDAGVDAGVPGVEDAGAPGDAGVLDAGVSDVGALTTDAAPIDAADGIAVPTSGGCSAAGGSAGSSLFWALLLRRRKRRGVAH